VRGRAFDSAGGHRLDRANAVTVTLPVVALLGELVDVV
jgi:hypothetical protein